jgi:hypothetical protein
MWVPDKGPDMTSVSLDLPRLGKRQCQPARRGEMTGEITLTIQQLRRLSRSHLLDRWREILIHRDCP